MSLQGEYQNATSTLTLGIRDHAQQRLYSTIPGSGSIRTGGDISSRIKPLPHPPQQPHSKKPPRVIAAVVF
jgi:hypothetical protein